MSAPVLPTYRVDVTRESGLWTAIVHGLPPGVVGATDVERFVDLEEAVCDLIAGLTDSIPADFSVQWSFVQDGTDYSSVIESLRDWEQRAAQAVAERDAHRRAAIASMRRAGLSMRDIGDVLGLSHQRVHQLLAEAS